MLDPARAKDDKVVRVYRQMTTGGYTAAFGTGMRMRIEGMSADELGIRPAKVQFDSLMAIVDAAPPPGTTATPAQLRDMFEKMAGLYEGAYLGSAEVRGLSIETPGGAVPARRDTARQARQRQARRVRAGRARCARAAGAGEDRPLRAQVARYRKPDARRGAILRLRRQPDAGSTGRARAAARGHRDQGLVAPYKDDQPAGQHRHAEPVMGPVRRADPDARARHAEDVRPGRPERSGAVQGARRRGHDQRVDHFRSRRRVDRGHARLRARAGDARGRQRAHRGGARSRSPTCRARYSR